METIKKTIIKNINYNDNYIEIENEIIDNVNSIYVKDNKKSSVDNHFFNYFLDLFNRKNNIANDNENEKNTNSSIFVDNKSLIKSISQVSIIENYLEISSCKINDINNDDTGPVIIDTTKKKEIKEIMNDDQVTQSIKFFDCFEENNINNVVSCEEDSDDSVNFHIFQDNMDFNKNEDIDMYEIDCNNQEKIKNKNQKNINRFGAVALSTFVVMGSALVSRFV
ncbi:Hypothetical protein KVN_LOCUS196 [uncultured virus]|nr:Hypothetical protein KVN_LOCUS196 [uncultured virus]